MTPSPRTWLPLMQALEAVGKALACNPDNAETRRKARDLRKLAGGGHCQPTADKENQSNSEGNTPMRAASQAQARQPLEVICTPAGLALPFMINIDGASCHPIGDTSIVGCLLPCMSIQCKDMSR